MQTSPNTGSYGPVSGGGPQLPVASIAHCTALVVSIAHCTALVVSIAHCSALVASFAHCTCGKYYTFTSCVAPTVGPVLHFHTVYIVCPVWHLHLLYFTPIVLPSTGAQPLPVGGAVPWSWLHMETNNPCFPPSVTGSLAGSGRL